MKPPGRLARRTPLRRTAALLMRPSPADPARDIRLLVIARDGALCVACGRPYAQLHHRCGRLGAHANSPAALICVCGLGNAAGCHGRIETDRAWAEPLGYRYSRLAVPAIDPATVPLLVHGIGLVLLDHAGGLTVIDHQDPWGEAA